MAQKKISIRIDGELVGATEGMTISKRRKEPGKRSRRSVTWTAHRGGACRLCVVEVAGIGRLLPACTTRRRMACR